MTALSPEREGIGTASTAPIKVHGSDADRLRLYQERIGEIEPQDLSNVFPVQWGKFCEPFVLDWIERTTQHEITERQSFIRHPTIPNLGATLDGYRPFDDAVIECKVLGPFATPHPSGDDKGFRTFYAPQVAIQMACRGAARGFLAVQQGNSAPQLFELDIDASYIASVVEIMLAFELCVRTRTPPAPLPAPPVLPEKWRTVHLDADSQENWVAAIKPALIRWHTSRTEWCDHEQAKKEIKEILPPDVGRATLGSLTIRRARNNAITITGAG